MVASSLPPFRKINFMSRDIELERRDDGSMVMRSRHELKPYERHVPAYLEHWAKATPDNVWLAQRRGPERPWRKVSFGEAKGIVDGLTQALLNLGLAEDRPVMILSGNSLEHAFMTQAAMQARLPAAPVSPGYSLMSDEFTKLKHVFNLLTPGVIMVQDGPPFERALKALDLTGVTVVHVERPVPGIASVSYTEWESTPVTEAVARSIAAIGPKTIGKLLFTSGSTGMPKAVINTQEMMTANVAMGQQAAPPEPGAVRRTVLDWLPWNHTMGGNSMFNAVLADGGMLYIDDGRPVPGQFDETLRNLREVSPTYYVNVPAGYAALASALEGDESLCNSFFKNVRQLAYGGATLSDDLYDRMQALAIKYTGHRLVFSTGWGCTETAPTATSTYWETERVGLIGLPFAGIELKMIPAGNKYELRLRGITVTPGYYRQPELTQKAFDEEGFYKIGDAGIMVNLDKPEEGLIFAGRVVEDFKLSTGTFVHVGSLRIAAVAAASPVIQDAVIAGQDKDFIAILAWPNVLACRQLAGLPEAGAEELIRHPAVIARLKEGLEAYNADNPGSSTTVSRALLMSEPPSVDGNEITDKGYINQRATLERRAALVDQLFAEPPGADVVVLGKRAASGSRVAAE
ncbi:AMP-binding protein [Chelatococcus reniformis]|uniref:Acyl-CoA synthetase n=1 Tax=Chelatococcus reniformis TaxID=1494448 RepID=A0A916XEL6_9HYPH|nr:AMP-binding protein [Chelatococcus reniformis]GGC66151.1 acyl-CoA synthetase [Chelatococcus reniformis]